MGKSLPLVLGGARSGKSTYAQQVAQDLGGRVLFVATALPFDEEMAARIQKHQVERPPGWWTLEAPREVGDALRAALCSGDAADVVLFDCLTLLANNLLLDMPEPVDPGMAQATLDGEVDGLLAVYEESAATWIVVSNEVGLGLVPPYPLGRVYRDILGRANQRLAQAADRVIFMVAGLPMIVKGKL